jgi:hypothetical protein
MQDAQDAPSCKIHSYLPVHKSQVDIREFDQVKHTDVLHQHIATYNSWTVLESCIHACTNYVHTLLYAYAVKTASSATPGPIPGLQSNGWWRIRLTSTLVYISMIWCYDTAINLSSIASLSAPRNRSPAHKSSSLMHGLHDDCHLGITHISSESKAEEFKSKTWRVVLEQKAWERR